MVQSIISLDEKEDRILNIIKAQHGLRNKSQAVELIVKIYADSFLELELRPEFIEKMKKRQLEPVIEIKDFKKHFGL